MPHYRVRTNERGLSGGGPGVRRALSTADGPVGRNHALEVVAVVGNEEVESDGHSAGSLGEEEGEEDVAHRCHQALEGVGEDDPHICVHTYPHHSNGHSDHTCQNHPVEEKYIRMKSWELTNSYSYEIYKNE